MLYFLRINLCLRLFYLRIHSEKENCMLKVYWGELSGDIFLGKWGRWNCLTLQFDSNWDSIFQRKIWSLDDLNNCPEFRQKGICIQAWNGYRTPAAPSRVLSLVGWSSLTVEATPSEGTASSRGSSQQLGDRYKGLKKRCGWSTSVCTSIFKVS